MTKITNFLMTAGIMMLGSVSLSQTTGNGPDRFLNIKAYRAEVNITFNYHKATADDGFKSSTEASQHYRNVFITTDGQPAVGDVFQVERGDVAEKESHEGDLMEGMDMDMVNQMLENSGLDAADIKEAKEGLSKAQGYHVGLDKYKTWMVSAVEGGQAKISVETRYDSESSGVMGCGEGLGEGPYMQSIHYQGSGDTALSKPGISNENGFVLQLNLDNNTYSFYASALVPNGFEVRGVVKSRECGKASEEATSGEGKAFIRIKNEKIGVVYKQPLPENGMTLSGSATVTDLYFLDSNFDDDGDWSVHIDWHIYPADE